MKKQLFLGGKLIAEHEFTTDGLYKADQTISGNCDIFYNAEILVKNKDSQMRDAIIDGLKELKPFTAKFQDDTGSHETLIRSVTFSLDNNDVLLHMKDITKK